MTKFKGIPEFHCHMNSLDTGSSLTSFMERAKELETGYLATTDHGTLGSCVQVYNLAKKNGLKPILGNEAYFRDDNCPILMELGIPKDKDGGYKEFIKYQHLTMHFLDQEAYQLGVKLISKADDRAEKHGSERKPLYDWSDLEELGSKNVTFGSSCLIGMVPKLILMHNDFSLAEKYYQKLRSIAKPGNFYVEIFPHDCSKDWQKGIFVHLDDGEIIRLTDKQKVKTNSAELNGETLLAEWTINKQAHEALVAAYIKKEKAWKDVGKRIVKVEYIADFVPNECRVWCPDGDLQNGINKFMIEMAHKYGDKIVISNDSHYAYPEDKIVQDIKLQQNGDWRFYGSYSVKDCEELFTFFNQKLDIDEKTFDGWCSNNYEWASRFDNFNLKYETSLPKKFYTDDTLDYTKKLIEKHGRMDWNNEVSVERLKKEIDLFHNNGTVDLLPYFFVCEQVCDFYRANGYITSPGRGSSGGVYLAYLLSITQVDPIKHDLSLDRFLTIDRIKAGKYPDIDMDFGTREPLVAEDGLLNKVFKDHWIQISVDSTIKLKSAVKDVHRALHGKVPWEIEQLTEKFKVAPQGVAELDFVFGYNDGDHEEPGSIDTDPFLQDYIKKFPEEWEIVQKCLGLARQKGRHASAYAILNEPVVERIPVQSVSDVKTSQYTASSVESVGVLEFDFLSVNQLNDINDALKMIQSDFDVPDKVLIDGKLVTKTEILPVRNKDGSVTYYHIWDLPEDLAVFDTFAKGKTETVFQFNKPGAIKALKNFNGNRPDGRPLISSVADLAIFTALNRPGPLDVYVELENKKHNMLVEYSRRVKGDTPVVSLQEWEDMFPKTHGVCCFQEDLKTAYQNLTDCSGVEAETFRSDVGKKLKEKIAKAYPKFIERASAKLNSQEKAEKAWELIQTWGRYGFCKAHAYEYALVAYACAYLKYHYPLQWWCSVLRNADKDEINEKFWTYCGHLIDFPDVNKSYDNFEIHNNRIVAPINLLKGIGEGAHNQLVSYRPYTSLQDFIEKIAVHKEKRAVVTESIDTDGNKITKKRLGNNTLNSKVMHSLIVCGVMDSLFPKDLSTIEKLDLWETKFAEHFDTKKKSIPEKLLNLNILTKIQLKKQILPVYSENLLPTFAQCSIPGFIENDGAYLFRVKNKDIPFIDGSILQRLEEVKILTQQFKAAVAVFIENVKIKPYDNGKKKRAEITFDINGLKFTSVMWPDYTTGKLNPIVKESLIGSLSILILHKYSEAKPFKIEQIIEVEKSLEVKEGSE